MDGIYLPFDRIGPEELARCVDECHRAGKVCLLALPYIFREREREALAAMLRRSDAPRSDGYLVRSADEAGFLAERGIPGLRIFDAGVYGWNTRAAQVQESFGADILTDAYELNRAEQENVRLPAERREMVAYGRLPMMISAQCVEKTRGHCRREKSRAARSFGTERMSGQESVKMPERMSAQESMKVQEESMSTLTDRRRKTFPVDCRCRFCTNIIYNTVPLWLLDQPEAFPARIRLSLTTETAQEARALIAMADSALRGEPAAPPSGMDITRGHFRRGVQ